MSNERKFETLGMPYGTANNKLRKRIIYNLLQTIEAYREKFGPISEGSDENGKWEYPARRLGIYCSRCGTEITSDDDMTIEHIKPWEGRENGRDLFWDYQNNIGFSHKWCNVAHVHPGSPRDSMKKFTSLEKYCPVCDTMKLLEDFSLNTSKPSQRENECRICRSNKRSGLVS